jgi:4-hydroxy-tetrahydrodipicolinate reductase
VDASQRREPLQRKIGSGMTAREFAKLAEAGRIGHVGLVESAAHLGGGLGWRLDRGRRDARTDAGFRAASAARSSTYRRGASRASTTVPKPMKARKLRVSLDLRMQLGADSRARRGCSSKAAHRCAASCPGVSTATAPRFAQLLSDSGASRRHEPGLHLASQLPAPRWAAARLTLRAV